MSETEYIACPYCGEEIRAVAKKCKHCGEWLDKDNATENNADSKNTEKEEKKEEGDSEKNQKIIVQPNIVVQNTNQVRQEQNVVVSSKSDDSPSGCLLTQLLIVAVGLGFAFHGFWYGVAAFILLGIAVFIPFLGPALCVILGLAFGALAGVVAAAFGAATWVAWLIGIVLAMGLIYGNLEQRKSED